jgi:transposase
VFHLLGFDRSGQVVLRRKIKRFALQETFNTLPRCIVGMEACLSAHFVSRSLRLLGFKPRIIPAIYVKPFNKGQKNDYSDAEAIAETTLRPNLRTVPEKDQDQLDLQALHRVRSRLVSRRTATINQIRAFLIEQGITVRSGLGALNSSFEAILDQRRDEISPRMRRMLIGFRDDWRGLDEQILRISEEIKEISRSEENCMRIMEAFDRRRDFAAWVGLVPQQFSTGG